MSVPLLPPVDGKPTNTSLHPNAPEKASKIKRAHNRNSSEPFPNWSNRPSIADPPTRSSPSSPFQYRLDRHTADRRRQRQQSPLRSSSRAGFDDQDCERIRQVFFPPFEEAGDKSILDVNRHVTRDTAGDKASVELQSPWSRVLFSGDRSIDRHHERREATHSWLVLEPSEASVGRHTRTRSSDIANTPITLHSGRWEYAPAAHATHASTLDPSILRESGVLLNSASTFTLNSMRLQDADITMESMEMRPQTLRRSVTSQNGTENVKVSMRLIFSTALPKTMSC